MADDLNPSLSPLGSRALGMPKPFPRDAPAVWVNLRRSGRWMLASIALVAGSLVWLGWPSAEPAEALVVRTPPPPLPVFTAPAPPPAQPEPIQLDDGSTIQLRTAGDVLRAQEQSDERVRLRLWGGAHFDVAPEPPPSFVVESAQVLVRVLGTTAFSVDPEDTRTRVAVERGRVQIMWWRGATILRAGESAVFPPENESAFGRSSPAARRDKDAPRPKHVTKHRKSRSQRAIEARAHVREPAVEARAHVREPAQAKVPAKARPESKTSRHERRRRRTRVAH